MRGRNFFIAAGFSVFLISGLFADETTVYIVRNVDFEIAGRTRSLALLIASDIKKGDEITGDAPFAAYLARKKQALQNRRQLEKVEITWSAGERDGNGKTPVDILVKTADTNNRIVLPYPKFTSSSGIKAELRYRDYNAFGMMSEFRINAGYAQDADGAQYANALLGFGSPFQLFGLLWNFDFDNQFSWRVDHETAPFFYKNTSWLYMNIPAGKTAVSLGVRQTAALKEEHLFDYDYTLSPFSYLVPAGLSVSYFHEYLDTYITENPFLAWNIPFEIKGFPFGDIAYRPEAGVQLTFFPEGYREEDYYKKGTVFMFSHSLSFSRIDWIGNFQKGLALTLENNNAFNRDSGEKNAHDVSASLAAHIPFSGLLAVSFRARYQRSLFTEYRYISIGGPLRGIPDRNYTDEAQNLYATEFAFFNLDIPVSLFKFYASDLFSNEKWSIVNFEVQAGPVLDGAVFRDTYGENAWDWLLSGGFEVKVFPLKFRSFFLRLSAAADLIGKSGSGPEIYIGIGNHY